MEILKKTAAAHTRSGPTAPDSTTPDARPYLVSPGRKYLSLFPHESEDARLTGETRNLFRRLLALNLPRVSAPVKAAQELNLEPRPTPRPAVMPDIKIA